MNAVRFLSLSLSAHLRMQYSARFNFADLLFGVWFVLVIRAIFGKYLILVLQMYLNIFLGAGVWDTTNLKI